jgi:hypothetical protein
MLFTADRDEPRNEEFRQLPSLHAHRAWRGGVGGGGSISEFSLSCWH